MRFNNCLVSKGLSLRCFPRFFGWSARRGKWVAKAFTQLAADTWRVRLGLNGGDFSCGSHRSESFVILLLPFWNKFFRTWIFNAPWAHRKFHRLLILKHLTWFNPTFPIFSIRNCVDRLPCRGYQYGSLLFSQRSARSQGSEHVFSSFLRGVRWYEKVH